MGYIRKAFEKGYLEDPGSACCTDDMFKIFARFGQCLCSLLPPFVNRQPPCLHTNSRHAMLHPQMHHRNPWFAKGHALGVQTGFKLLARCPVAKQKRLAQPVHNKPHAPTTSTRF